MAALGKNTNGKKGFGGVRRVSPLKPGLRGARNWTSAQIRAARYNPKRLRSLIVGSVILFALVIWTGLWLGGYLPQIRAGYQDAIKHRLMKMGFVVRHIDVVGEGRVREAKVRAMLGVRPGDYLYDMDIKAAQARIQSLSWVDTVVVRRLWPDHIVVHINERVPYALWQRHREIVVIDAGGKVIKDARAEDFAALPFVVGTGANREAASMLATLQTLPDLQSQTRALVFVGDRRWDIVLNNGTRILLPEKHPVSALQRLASYNREHELLGLDVNRIDLRIKGRLILAKDTHSKTPRA